MILRENEKRDIENEKPNLKCQVGTMGFSNASLEYLNYPTQVESKLLQHVCHDKKNLESRKIVLSGDLQMLQADSCASRWNTHPGDQSLLTMVVIDVEKKVTGIVIYVFGHCNTSEINVLGEALWSFGLFGRGPHVSWAHPLLAR